VAGVEIEVMMTYCCKETTLVALKKLKDIDSMNEFEKEGELLK
jgi:hypothetical protein